MATTPTIEILSYYKKSVKQYWEEEFHRWMAKLEHYERLSWEVPYDLRSYEDFPKLC